MGGNLTMCSSPEGVKICSYVTKHTVSFLASFTVRILFNKSSQCVLRLRIEKTVSICREQVRSLGQPARGCSFSSVVGRVAKNSSR